jgi:putative transposase
MPQSLSKVYVHIVFSTKNRKHLIDEFIEPSLYEYLGGICKGLECYPVRIGGYSNHIHVLCLLSRKVTQMKLVEELKKQSSKWIKTKGITYSHFYWQNGYGFFSVNYTKTDKVIDYIEKQHEHHKQKNFQNEFLAFLKINNIEYDDRFVWD